MSSSQNRVWHQLAGAFVLIGIVWLGVLPWLSRVSRINEELDRLAEKGIDPSAMYYTELDAIDLSNESGFLRSADSDGLR